MFNIGKTVIAGDAALFVSAAGKAGGQPIILLHGGLGSRDDFLPLAKHLAADYRLIAIDSRGHGRSALGDLPLTYRRLEQDAAAVLAELGLTDAGIIGHSDGGIVALRLAASGAVRPRFVVAAGAHCNCRPMTRPAQSIRASRWTSGGMFPQQVQHYEAETPRLILRCCSVQPRPCGSGTMTTLSGAGSALDRRPLLVVHGDEDFPGFPPSGFELVEQVEGARLLNLPSPRIPCWKTALKTFFLRSSHSLPACRRSSDPRPGVAVPISRWPAFRVRPCGAGGGNRPVIAAAAGGAASIGP